VMMTRQELGAKMLSHHSGRTSTLFIVLFSLVLCHTRESGYPVDTRAAI
jgi:hypothetical protein